VIKTSENIIINDDCINYLTKNNIKINVSFLDPPFNQGKDYRINDDNLPEDEYWDMIENVCKLIYDKTVDGGSIYFMQREKNANNVMDILKKTGWVYQNLIIWKKKTSAVPNRNRFGLNYQIIVFATKGKPETFNRLRINVPRLITEKYERLNGTYVTDVWDDIRELTSGYFAGDEALRDSSGNRFHKQQAPIALLLRIILSSSNINDLIFDPFAGTGTTLIVAKQLLRRYIGIEIDPENVMIINKRLIKLRNSDNIDKYYKDYIHTENLDKIWKPKNYKIDKIFDKSIDDNLIK